MADAPFGKLISKATSNTFVTEKTNAFDTVVWDEISMTSGRGQNFLHEIVSSIRVKDLLFGALQVSIVGDWSQLRPVPGNMFVATWPTKERELGIPYH